MHKCDIRPCIEPRHLMLGTVKDNTQDMINKGRRIVGVLNGRATLTEQDVVMIRYMYSEGFARQEDIARYFGGLTKAAVSLLVRGKNWSHVGGPITCHKFLHAAEYQRIKTDQEISEWISTYRGRHVRDRKTVRLLKKQSPNS